VDTVFLVAIGLVGIPAEAIGAQFGKEDLETISLGSGWRGLLFIAFVL